MFYLLGDIVFLFFFLFFFFELQKFLEASGYGRSWWQFNWASANHEERKRTTHTAAYHWTQAPEIKRFPPSQCVMNYRLTVFQLNSDWGGRVLSQEHEMCFGSPARRLRDCSLPDLFFHVTMLFGIWFNVYSTCTGKSYLSKMMLNSSLNSRMRIPKEGPACFFSILRLGFP